MSLNPEDYKEPRCLSCTDFYYPDENANVTPIPVDRVVDRLDILLSHNDMPAARRHLEYWLSEARMGGDKRGELAVLNELMGLYRKMGLKDKAFESAEKADELVKNLSLGGSITAATVSLNAAPSARRSAVRTRLLSATARRRAYMRTFWSPRIRSSADSITIWRSRVCRSRNTPARGSSIKRRLRS